VAVSRAERRAARRGEVERVIGEANADAALDLLELIELAWHDCYGEVTPPDQVIADILVVSRGQLSRLISAGLLAVKDHRDLRVAANDERE
jgi:hypothetical protein